MVGGHQYEVSYKIERFRLLGLKDLSVKWELLDVPDNAFSVVQSPMVVPYGRVGLFIFGGRNVKGKACSQDILVSLDED